MCIVPSIDYDIIFLAVFSKVMLLWSCKCYVTTVSITTTTPPHSTTPLYHHHTILLHHTTPPPHSITNTIPLHHSTLPPPSPNSTSYSTPHHHSTYLRLPHSHISTTTTTIHPNKLYGPIPVQLLVLFEVFEVCWATLWFHVPSWWRESCNILFLSCVILLHRGMKPNKYIFLYSQLNYICVIWLELHYI